MHCSTSMLIGSAGMSCAGKSLASMGSHSTERLPWSCHYCATQTTEGQLVSEFLPRAGETLMVIKPLALASISRQVSAVSTPPIYCVILPVWTV